MSLEKGLVRLQEQLRRIDDEEAIRRISELEVRLRTLLKRRMSNTEDPNMVRELECTIDDLNKVAYRTIGRSFIDLCNRPRPNLSDSMLFFSLRGVLLLVIAALFLPVFGIVLASTRIKINNQWQVERIRREIQVIDERIGSAVISPFYLSYVFPCSDTALQAIRTTDNLNLIKSSSTIECVWKYVDNETGQVIAKDYWIWFLYPALQKREYYSDGIVIAQDLFDPQGNDCFKHRVYFDDQVQVLGEDCFTEAGILRTRKHRKGLISPIPPMLYWFFYR